MKTLLPFSTILIALFAVNISNAQCTQTANSFGNNSVSSYNITGDVTVILETGEKKFKLELGTNFSTAAGPDVKVYLIKSNGSSNAQLAAAHSNSLPSENIFLGQVSGSGIPPNGAKSFTADIPTGTVISDYDTVFFYCLQANVFWDLGGFTPFTSTNCNALGIEESVFSKQITTYPNPVVDKLHINNSNSNAVRVKLYSILGELLFEEKMSSEKTIKTSLLSSGIYLVELSSGDKKLIRKIVKR